MSEPAPARPAVTMRKLAPAFPVSDLAAPLAHYARLGFTTSEYTGDSAAGGYGFARRDNVELQLDTVPTGRTASPTTAYLYVDDANALAAEWRETGPAPELMPLGAASATSSWSGLDASTRDGYDVCAVHHGA